MNMSEDDPRRMEEIRKYAAIYGRFDCKRKPEKPLTLHEVRRGAWIENGKGGDVKRNGEWRRGCEWGRGCSWTKE